MTPEPFFYGTQYFAYLIRLLIEDAQIALMHYLVSSALLPFPQVTSCHWSAPGYHHQEEFEFYNHLCLICSSDGLGSRALGNYNIRSINGTHSVLKLKTILHSEQVPPTDLSEVLQ